MSQNTRYYIGVDVGTGSVRAALVDQSGSLMASSIHPTKTWRDAHDHRIFEQSTKDIWSAVASTIKACLQESGVKPEDVKGLGFDSTCSLSVTDVDGKPIVVTKGEHLGEYGERNVILWVDHRSEKEVDLINSTGSIALDYVGGKISLDLEVPKILWLKKNMKPSLFSKCQFFTLPDFLTYRATNNVSRSSCSLTYCKTSHVPSGWHDEFFHQIGLDEIVENQYSQIGAGEPLIAGLPIAEGLSKEAAEELGLVEGTPVGSGIIDAYAGWLGSVAARYEENGKLSDVVPSLEEGSHRLAVIAGTSTCHLVQSPEGIFVDGVWGPFKDIAINGWSMTVGGQTSTGQLIDFIITTHPAYQELVKLGEEQQKNIHTVLEEKLEKLRVENNVGSLTELIKDLHIYPDFHGNRSPIADQRMQGSIVGLSLDSSLASLALSYSATLHAIVLQTRHIIDTMNSKGHHISSIYMSGGQAKNASLMQLMADVCNMGIVLPKDGKEGKKGGVIDPVVLGSAMLGRYADEASKAGAKGREGQAERMWDIMVEMTPVGTLIPPKATNIEKKLLESKYRIFLESIEIQKRWRKQMEDAANEVEPKYN